MYVSIRGIIMTTICMMMMIMYLLTLSCRPSVGQVWCASGPKGKTPAEGLRMPWAPNRHFLNKALIAGGHSGAPLAPRKSVVQPLEILFLPAYRKRCVQPLQSLLLPQYSKRCGGALKRNCPSQHQQNPFRTRVCGCHFTTAWRYSLFTPAS